MLATAKTLIAYRAAIVPRARREIRRWAQAAETIPDPTLRHAATSAIATDTGNALAISALAATAPRRLRRRTVELVVTYQVLVDYIDRLNENVCVGQLLRGLRVGLALSSALAEPASPIKVDPLGDDGGYLAGLVASCRERLWSLPSAAAIQRQARTAAARCSEALAYTHTAAETGPLVEVRRWTASQKAPGRYSWWELAAGGTSNIAVTALLAAASDPETTVADASKVATAYWPHICVLSTMLDSLVDFERDAITGEFSFVSYYAGAAAAREGLIRAARLSLAATRSLRHSRIHAMIVYGVAGYYAASAVRGSLASSIAPRLLTSLGPTAMPIVSALRASHRIRASRETLSGLGELRSPATRSARRDSLPDAMAEQVPAVGDILTTIERRDWRRLERLLDPDVHWTTAAEEHLHGPAEVIARLSDDPPPAAPAYHEMQDGMLVRWIDTPG